MNRAATVLSAASVVLGIGAGLLGQQSTTAIVRTLLVVALLSYVPLAVLMVLAFALRPARCPGRPATQSVLYGTTPPPCCVDITRHC